MCNDFCKSNPYTTGVGVVLVNKNYDNHRGIRVKHALLFGKELGGQYAGMFNVVGGKRNCGECILDAIFREIREEIKIDLGVHHLKDKQGDFRFFHHHTTIIFIALLPKGFSRTPVNQNIDAANRNWRLPACQREMECVDWFDAASGRQIEGKHVVLSRYAQAVIRGFNNGGFANRL